MWSTRLPTTTTSRSPRPITKRTSARAKTPGGLRLETEGDRFCLEHELVVSPTPAVMRERSDYFDNRTCYFGIHESHRSLRVVATSVVEVRARSAPLPAETTPWEQVRDRVARDRRKDVLRAYGYTFDSPFIRAAPELAELARPSFPPGRPLREAMVDLTAANLHRLHLRSRRDPDLHPAVRGDAPPPRCLPRLRAPRDRLLAVVGSSGALRERLSAHATTSRETKAGRRRRIARLVLHLRARCRVARLRSGQQRAALGQPHRGRPRARLQRRDAGARGDPGRRWTTQPPRLGRRGGGRR